MVGPPDRRRAGARNADPSWNWSSVQLDEQQILALPPFVKRFNQHALGNDAEANGRNIVMRDFQKMSDPNFNPQFRRFAERPIRFRSETNEWQPQRRVNGIRTWHLDADGSHRLDLSGPANALS